MARFLKFHRADNDVEVTYNADLIRTMESRPAEPEVQASPARQSSMGGAKGFPPPMAARPATEGKPAKPETTVLHFSDSTIPVEVAETQEQIAKAVNSKSGEIKDERREDRDDLAKAKAKFEEDAAAHQAEVAQIEDPTERASEQAAHDAKYRKMKSMFEQVERNKQGLKAFNELAEQEGKRSERQPEDEGEGTGGEQKNQD